MLEINQKKKTKLKFENILIFADSANILKHLVKTARNLLRKINLQMATYTLNTA